MRACIPRFLFSLDAHMRLRYNSNYTGEFLRGFSCTAFASIRGYKPAVPFFPPFPPPKYAERVISNKLAVLYAKRLVNVRISCMIISFETRTTSLYLCLLDYLENSVKIHAYILVLGILTILFSRLIPISPIFYPPSNSRIVYHFTYFWIIYFVRVLRRNPQIIDYEFLEVGHFLFLSLFISSLSRNSSRNNWQRTSLLVFFLFVIPFSANNL